MSRGFSIAKDTKIKKIKIKKKFLNHLISHQERLSRRFKTVLKSKKRGKRDMKKKKKKKRERWRGVGPVYIFGSDVRVAQVIDNYSIYFLVWRA